MCGQVVVGVMQQQLQPLGHLEADRAIDSCLSGIIGQTLCVCVQLIGTDTQMRCVHGKGFTHVCVSVCTSVCACLCEQVCVVGAGKGSVVL